MEDAYTSLAGKLGYRDSERLKTILNKVMDDEDARLVASLPANLEELSGKMGKPVEEINCMLQELFMRGVVFITSDGYQFARTVMQFRDAIAIDARLDEKYAREILDLWKEFSEADWFKDIAKLVQEKQRASWRVIPALGTVASGSKILPTENLEVIIEKVTRFAVIPCPCRRTQQNCRRPIEVCLQFNRSAEYMIKRGVGRELTREEAMEVLEKAEEGGLIHISANSAKVDRFICNCCGDCCIIFYPLIKYGGLEKDVAKSRFQAGVNQDLCIGCQDCIERCPLNAIDIARVTGQMKLKAEVNSAKCYGCGLCAVGCSVQAIKLIEVRPAEFEI